MEELNKIIANNLVKSRKNAKLTQLELAEKLMYSDKNVSKWERGDSVPDVVILKQLADIYGITVNAKGTMTNIEAMIDWTNRLCLSPTWIRP